MNATATRPLPKITPELIRAAWASGRLAYRFRNIQRLIKQKWIASKAISRKFYIETNRRLGKSTWLLMLGAEECIHLPNRRVGYFAPVREGLLDYIEPIIEKVFAECPEDLKPIFHKQRFMLEFPNGSTIVFRGSNMQTHRTKRGQEFHLALIDECRDVDDLATLIDSVVFPALFSTDGYLIMSSTPADTFDHPLRDYQQRAEKEGWYFHCTIYDCHQWDPEWFTLARIEEWRRETTNTASWEREYMAKWVVDATKIIVAEWTDKFKTTVKRNELFPFYHKYVSLDFGVQHKTAGGFAYYDYRMGKLVVEDEFVLQYENVRADNIAANVKHKESDLGYSVYDFAEPNPKKQLKSSTVYRRVCDNNNPQSINDLNGTYGLTFYGTSKDDLVAMLGLLKDWVNKGRILVNPKCVETLGCLQNAQWNLHRTDLATSKVFGHFDALMQLCYMVRNVDVTTNPIPRNYGMSIFTHHIEDEKPVSENGAVLRKVFKIGAGSFRTEDDWRSPYDRT